jgi:hypothetical protein
VFDIVLLSLEISKPYSWRCLYIISCLIVCVIFNLMEAFILLRINWTFVQWESESMYWTMTQIVSRLAVTLKKVDFAQKKQAVRWSEGEEWVFIADHGLCYLGIKLTHPYLMGIRLWRTWVFLFPGYYLFLGFCFLFIY